MSLREEQQRMLGLLKQSKAHDAGDPVLTEKLEFQKKIIVWWRCFQLEHWLILTSKVLKDQNLLEPLVRDFYYEHNLSSYPMEVGEDFVTYLQNKSVSPIIKSIASLELALIKIKDPTDKTEYRIPWNVSPLPLLEALINGRQYTLDCENNFSHEMFVSNVISETMFVREIH